MRPRALLTILLLLLTSVVSADDAAYKLQKADKLPTNTPKNLAALLNTNGHAVATKKGVTMRLWTLKEIPGKADFKPTGSVKYPFAFGQLVGLLQVEQSKKISDFRQQEIGSGLYSVRYGVMPQDGNHIGASELFDFFLAVPVAKDSDLKPIADLDALAKKSAAAAQSSHPAIFSLLPAEKKTDARLEHDEDNEFWILNFSTAVKQQDKVNQIPVRLVVVGHTEG